MSAIGGGLRRGDEVQGRVVITGPIGGRRVGGRSYIGQQCTAADE